MTGFYRRNAFAGQDPAVYNRELKHKEIWRGIVQRCTNPNQPSWENYGGRGVTICDRWNPKVGGSYENFISDMGYRPSNKHHLDKEAIDRHNLVYGPEKCRWVHRKFNQSAERKRKARKPDPLKRNSRVELPNIDLEELFPLR